MRTLLLIVFLPLLFPVSGSADYYRYVDKNGIVRYVDTMSKVPKAYQDQVVYHVMPKGGVKWKGKSQQNALLKKKMGIDEEHAVLLKEKKELLESVRQWEEKYKAWENKKSALDKKMR